MTSTNAAIRRSRAYSVAGRRVGPGGYGNFRWSRAYGAAGRRLGPGGCFRWSRACGRLLGFGGWGYPAAPACGVTAACSTSISDSPRRFAS
ncbi:hypothetical protein GCM10023196_078650 [Actinoallomurus vinaceus]|uniref:Uncharacterized protein n=1 Tax=Actinoallomurus vinaceus TaxID=1080074 RepID=A0ABP8UMP0_9ACTN